MIHQAMKADAMTVAQLAVQMWSSHTIEELTADFESLIADENAVVFLYYANERAIGFAQCQLRNDYVEGATTSPLAI